MSHMPESEKIVVTLADVRKALATTESLPENATEEERLAVALTDLICNDATANVREAINALPLVEGATTNELDDAVCKLTTALVSIAFRVGHELGYEHGAGRAFAALSR